MELQGKVTIVTGAGSGMGRTAARIFAREGARVVGTDVRADLIDEVRREIEGAGGEMLAVAGDASNEGDVQRAVSEAERRFGPVTALYNNAGIMPADDEGVETMDEGVWDRVLAINVKAVALYAKHVIPSMRKAGGGAIVNVASFVALLGCTVPQDAYTASKGAVLSLTRSLAVQYGRQGIRVNAISPGPIETPLMRELLKDPDKRNLRLNRIPLGRFGDGEDVIEAASFLLSDRAAWITGANLMVDGGITVNYF